MHYVPLKIKQSCTVIVEDSLKSVVDLKALAVGCVGVMLVFEDKNHAANYAKAAHILEIK